MVLALSDEAEETVAEYVDNMNLTIRVAAGHKSTGPFAVGRGIPRSYLIGADGKVLWAGHPNSLRDGQVKDALKKVKGTGSYLSFSPKGEYSDKAVNKAVGMVKDAKLGKALAAAVKMSSNPEGGEQANQAAALAEEINAHATLLIGQAEALLAKKEMVVATGVLETLEKEFKGQEIADRMKARLAEIKADETLRVEWDADKALSKLKKKAAKSGWRKQIKKLESLAKKYPGTQAAKKAKKLIRSANS